MLSSKCEVRDSKNSKFIKEQEGSGCFHHNVKCVIVKTRNLSKSKKVAD